MIKRANNSQSRKWALVINNPLDAGLGHEAITEILMRFSPTYFCMADEIAETGTFHTHVFVYSNSPIRFTTIKSRLPVAHIEKAYGSAKQNRDYVRKSGRWADSDKAETSVEDSFFEYGEMPAEKEEVNPEMYHLIKSVRDGESTTQIIDNMPKMAFRVRDIETLRQTLLTDRYSSENRILDVMYLFGETGVGKTRFIYEQHDPKEICRITNYNSGRGVCFDAYSGQNVLVFEEFHSQIPIGEMLNFLDIYPLTLPARYTDRVACYTKVYLTSNIPLEEQYRKEQRMNREIWKAFLRRIQKVVEFTSDGSKI